MKVIRLVADVEELMLLFVFSERGVFGLKGFLFHLAADPAFSYVDLFIHRMVYDQKNYTKSDD